MCVAICVSISNPEKATKNYKKDVYKRRMLDFEVKLNAFFGIAHPEALKGMKLE